MPLNKVTADSIADGTVIAADIADGSITSPKIAAGAVTGNTLSTNIINANNIVNSSILGNNLADNVIRANNIVAGTITGNLIATGQITGNLLGATSVSSNNIISSVSLTTPILGTPTSGNLGSCTADGTNSVGYKNIPSSGAKTSSYTLVAGDVGKFIELGTGGSIVVPASVFAAGDAISIFNNTSSSISCTCSAVTTFYKGGTDTDISSFSVTTRGVATILFVAPTVAVVTGNLA